MRTRLTAPSSARPSRPWGSIRRRPIPCIPDEHPKRSKVTRVIEVRVPDMGNFKDVAVIDVLVKPGDAVEVEGPLVTLETEKATMDVPSTVAGIIEKILATKGGIVSPGDVVATV